MKKYETFLGDGMTLNQHNQPTTDGLWYVKEVDGRVVAGGFIFLTDAELWIAQRT